MIAKLDGHHERMTARTDSQLEKMNASLEKMGVTEEIEPESTHQEVPKEEAAVETFGALKERYRDRHLAVGSRRKPKKQTPEEVGRRLQSDDQPRHFCKT
jgi:hypothetical protein